MQNIYRKPRKDSFCYSSNHASVSPKVKIKLSPLDPSTFKSRETGACFNFPLAHTSFTKSIENRSLEYESAIQQHLQLRLKSRESIEEEQSPLIKISTQSPKRFKLKSTSKSMTEEDLLPINPTISTQSPNSPSSITHAQPSKYKKSSLDANPVLKSPRFQGSIEEMRLFLAKIKNK